MQCCGVGFIVGDKIELKVGPERPVDKYFYGVDVDYIEDHHDEIRSGLGVIAGTVTGITALYRTYREDNGVLIPDKSEKIESEQATGWHDDIGEYKFAGYFVVLEDCSVVRSNQMPAV